MRKEEFHIKLSKYVESSTHVESSIKDGCVLSFNFQPPIRSSSPERGFHLKSKLLQLKDPVLILTVSAIFLKSFLFLGLVNNNGRDFSFLKAIYSFSSPPSPAVYLLFSLSFVSFAFLFQRRWRYWALFLINMLISVFLIADLLYYRAFANFLSPFLFSQVSNLDNLSTSVISLLAPIDCLIVIDLFVFLVIGLRFRRLYGKVQRSIFLCILLLVISISGIYVQHVRLDLKGNGETMLFRVAWAPNQTLTNLSPLGYHLYDLYNYYQDSKPYNLTAQEEVRINSWFAGKENLPPNEYDGMFKGKNLLIIQVESLESSVIGRKVAGQEITPNLNKLLNNSFYFSNYYEQVYTGNSSDAELMTNTSVYPVRKGSTFFRFPQNTYYSLPDLLEQHGYSTQAIHPDKGSLWNWQAALQAIGFEKTYDASCFVPEEEIGLGLSDGSFLKQALPLITEKRQPFYTFIVTLTSHSPFEMPEKYQNLELAAELNQTKLGGYFQSLHYTDEQLGIFLSGLEEQGILENTVVALYGDHTGVHKYYNEEIQAMQAEEDWWYDDSKRVPLLIYAQDLAGKEIKTTGGQIDLFPTLAYLMGIPLEEYQYSSFGRNLLNTREDFAVLSNGECVGSLSPTEQLREIQGLELADLLLRCNYFKD